MGALEDALNGYNATDAPDAPPPFSPDVQGALPAAASAPGTTPPFLPSTSNNPPNAAPAQGGALQAALAPDLPRFHRTFMNTLKGIMLGYMQGNITGAIQGGIDPQTPVRYQQQQRQIMSAQAADVLNRARINEINLQNLPQQLRDEHDKLVLDQVKYLTAQYGAPDETFDNSSDAAHEALQKHVVNGNVPLAHVLSDSGTTYAWHADKASQASNAFTDVHNAGVLNGNPSLSAITQAQWDQMSQADKSSAWTSARQILTPAAPATDPKVRAGQLLAANRQLQTVQALPDSDSSKAGLVKFAQDNLGILNAADNDPGFADKVDENSRQQFLQGIQSSNLPADLKKTYTNFINQAKRGAEFDQATKTVTQDIGKYQTGIDAARQKAADQQAQNQEWKPKVTADEKKKTELAENLAENAAVINSILARRPDLVGKLAGRISQGKQYTGTDDQDLSALEARVQNFGKANAGVHSLRSYEGVKDTEQAILNNYKNGPAAVKGALNATVDSAQTFIDDARPSTYPTHSSQGGAAQYYSNRQSGNAVKAPAGATMKVPGSDGKLHWSDGKQDLGVVQ